MINFVLRAFHLGKLKEKSIPKSKAIFPFTCNILKVEKYFKKKNFTFTSWVWPFFFFFGNLRNLAKFKESWIILDIKRILLPFLFYNKLLPWN